MRSLIFSLFCVILFLPVIPSACAQAQLPPPDYTVTCSSQVYLDVDPETAQLPTDTIECSIHNQESYAIEFSLQSTANGLETSLSVNEITVGGNAEEFFEVAIMGEDGMLMSTLMIKTTSEVTKTGELDYSDDEPKETNVLVEIMQYAAFTVEPQQSETYFSLENQESFELVYSITNTGNFVDKFGVALESYTARICDTTREVGESEIRFNECEGGYYVPPISNDCEEKLEINLNPDRASRTWEIAHEQTVDIYFIVSGFISNSSCWPTDSMGNLALSFDMTLDVRSEFHSRYERSGELQLSDGSPHIVQYSVEVSIEGDAGLINQVTPGFESVNLILCSLVVIYLLSRRD